MSQATEYDLFSPAFKIDPFPTYAAMRRDAPIFAHEAPDGRTIWYITRYDDVVDVLKDHDRFIKDYAKAISGDRPATHKAINQNMLFADPPDHTRLRALVNVAFTPRRIQAIEPRIQQIADQLLDVVQADGAMDLIAAYALPLPVTVICDLLGIPAADQAQVATWSQAIISPGSRGLSYGQRKRQRRRFVAYLRALFAERRSAPQDDLITALVQAEADGAVGERDALTESELSSMVALLLVTGHETTVNLIGNGVLALLRHPDQLERLRRDVSLMDSAVEELLRYDGPVETSTTRWAARDLIFRGHQMRRGDVVRAVITSANRDGAHFDQPDALLLDRQENRHLQFGVGIHYCLGAPLARLEGRIALATLLRRLPGLALDDRVDAALTWRSGVLFRGLAHLPVRWSV